MANVQPKKSEDGSEDEKCTSRKRPNGIKPEGIKRNERYLDELGRPSSPTQPKNKSDFFTIKKDTNFGKLLTEIKEFEELSDKDLVGKPSGKKLVVPSTSTGEDIATDYPLGNNSPTSKEEIQLNSQIFYPEEKQNKPRDLSFNALL